MGMRILPCDDPLVAARRAKAREKQNRYNAARRACAPAEAPRVNGTVVFEAVTCPRCGDVFRGSRPLNSYAVHRNSICPWFDADEKAAHDALVHSRATAIAVQRTRRLRDAGLAPKRKYTPQPRPLELVPPLHTGHELFEHARAARRYWPTTESRFAYPIYEDMLSEGVLALLEGRDPGRAMREYKRREDLLLISLDAEIAPGIFLHETLAA